jgi:thiol-disulfide isomerase/thioredoxin
MNKNALFALLGATVIALGIYWFNTPESKVHVAPAVVVAETGSMSAFLKHATPLDVPPFTFVDSSGAEKDLSVLKGKVTLLNLWATWCAPCRKEMPVLANLQKELGGADFQVVELSEDLKGYGPSADFLKSVGADSLTLYADDKAKALDAIRGPGLPITLLLNRDGKEIGRLIGPAPWASDEAKVIIKAAMDAK